jgi:hypothetical protein
LSLIFDFDYKPASSQCGLANLVPDARSRKTAQLQVFKVCL